MVDYQSHQNLNYPNILMSLLILCNHFWHILNGHMIFRVSMSWMLWIKWLFYYLDMLSSYFFSNYHLFLCCYAMVISSFSIIHFDNIKRTFSDMFKVYFTHLCKHCTYVHFWSKMLCSQYVIWSMDNIIKIRTELQ